MNPSRKTPSSNIALTPKQANIYLYGWQPDARYRYAACGRRFGKSYLGVKEIRRAAKLAVQRDIHPDNEIWYGAPTFKQAKRVFWKRLKRGIPDSWRASRPNETECSITLVSGHVIRIVGLDSYDNLRGSGLWFFIGDEWADCPAAAWDEVIRPMLSTCGGHALFIGTPKGFNHFYEGYVAGRPGGEVDTKSWHYTTEQGGNVPPEEIEAAKRRLDPRTYRQEYGASFENYSGRIYYAFERTASVLPCPYDESLPVHVGMDFNVNPMCATVWQEHGNEVWQIDEVIIPTSNTDEMAEEIAKRYGRPSGLKHITVYPDPAGAQRRTSAQGRTDITILRDKGFSVLAMSTHPLVRDRINVVNARFQSADGTRRAFVDPKCRTSIKCLEQQIYKEGTSDPDKESGLDHPNDATGYFMYGKYAYKPPRGTDSINIFSR